MKKRLLPYSSGTAESGNGNGREQRPKFDCRSSIFRDTGWKPVHCGGGLLPGYGSFYGDYGITVGIGSPFLIAQGGNPVVIGALGLTAGYCGTLMTPMAANFNIMPAALLEMKNSYGIIRAQAPVAVLMLFFMWFLCISGHFKKQADAGAVSNKTGSNITDIRKLPYRSVTRNIGGTWFSQPCIAFFRSLHQ